MDYNFLKQKYDLSNGDISRLKERIKEVKAVSKFRPGVEDAEYYLAEMGMIPLKTFNTGEAAHALNAMKATKEIGRQIIDVLGDVEGGQKKINAAAKGERALIHGRGGESKE